MLQDICIFLFLVAKDDTILVLNKSSNMFNRFVVKKRTF